MLPQGGNWAQFYDGDDGIRLPSPKSELKAGSIRGNNFHKVKRKGFYIWSGESHRFTLSVEKVGSAKSGEKNALNCPGT